MLFLFEEYALDTDRRELRRGPALLSTEPQVFDLLVFLVSNRDRVVSKDDLLASIWRGRIVSESTVASRINAARRLIGDSGTRQQLIRTTIGRGIRFVGTVREEHERADLDVADVTNIQPSSPLATRDRPRVAVLPFTNISRDQEQDYFVEGMTQEIITALSRVRWFLVIACNPVFGDKAEPVDVKRVGRELDARYVIEGSVRKADGRVRVSAQLIDAATAEHLWAGKFDGSLEDVFELQDQVALSVSGVIEPTLEAAEIRRALSRRTTDLTAYDLYLRALPLVVSRGKDQVNRALDLLRQAIERDPCYGPALALAAACHVYLHASGWTDNPEVNRRDGLDLARRALQFADEDPSVLARSAYALGYFEQDIDPAIGLIERALELNPGCVPAWPISGWLRLWAGQPDRAIHDFEAYQRLRGLRATIHPGIGVAYLFSRRFEEARKSLLLSLEDFPGWVPTYRFLACCYAQMDRLGEAREIVKRLRALTPVVVPSATNWRNPGDRELLLSGLRLACTPPGSTMVDPVRFLRSRAGGRGRRHLGGLAQSGERDIAVLFADIRGFTALYEAQPPSDILLILNRYYAVMGSIVEKSGGRVGECIGDSVRAFFGIAGDPQAGCCQALTAARLMSVSMAELNASLREKLSEPLQIGIGIHAGLAFVGMRGYRDATTLTAIGDTVVTASGLEGLTKKFQCELILSEEVVARGGLVHSTFCWRQIDLPGRSKKMMVAIIDRAVDLPLLDLPTAPVAAIPVPA